MKKLSLVLALALTLSLAACGSRTNSPANSNTSPTVTSPDTPSTGSAANPGTSDTAKPAGDNSAPAGDGSGILIAYFGVPETYGTDTVAAQEPDAQVERSGFSVSRNSVSAAKNDIVDWVRELGYTKANQPAPTPDSGADVLVAYFSQTGTTEGVARQIAEYTNGDLAEIKRAQPYGNLQDEAKAEIDNGTRPDITMDVSNLDRYDVIFIGYPIWWDKAPAMIATFLAENDLSGKIVAPFCTSSCSPITNSLHIFRELASGATVVDGLTANSESAVRP